MTRSNWYSLAEWRFIKGAFICVWLVLVIRILLAYSEIPVPTGLCNVLECRLILGVTGKIILFTGCAVFAILYLLEVKMRLTAFLLFICSVIVFSIEESNGVLSRSGLISFIFLAQGLAYHLREDKTGEQRYSAATRFSIQAIAAAYTLSAISKLSHSGLQWVTQGKLMKLQVLKSYETRFATTANEMWLLKGERMIAFIDAYPLLITCLLSLALLLELCAVVAVINKKTALLYGLALLAMHVGMYLVMNIFLFSIFFPMFVFMLNPLYKVWQGVLKSKKLLSI